MGEHMEPDAFKMHESMGEHQGFQLCIGLPLSAKMCVEEGEANAYSPWVIGNLVKPGCANGLAN